MKAIIESINIYDNKGSHRYVEFTDGINVITGDSKTGKSALLEIVDYCLFSKTSGIPKGIITDFADFFSVVFKLKDIYIVIGRSAPKTNLGSKAYIKTEFDKNIISPLQLSYFNGLRPVTLKAAQAKFESYLGLSVLDMQDDINSFHHGKASIRNAVSLLFQHQNLIANKHALFYRFHDFIKRERTIKELPIFLGWVDGNYYRLVRQLDEYQKKLRTQEKIESYNIKDKSQQINTLRLIIEDYLTLIGHDIKEHSTYEKILEIAKNLPPVPDIPNGSPQNHSTHSENELLLSQLTITLFDINKKIAQLESTSNLAIENAINLNKLKNTFSLSDDVNDIKCPLCSQSHNNLTNKMVGIRENQNKLINDISKLRYYHEDTSKEMESLTKERDSLKHQMRIINIKIKEHEKNESELLKIKNFREKASFLKGKASTLVSSFIESNKIINNSETKNELITLISKIKKELKKYNLEEKYEKKERSLNKMMTDICNELDFESELKPADLHFSLKNFDFYHKHDGQNISLHEMGSGANWLACHLSIFLGLLTLLSLEEKSCIPTFLFLDQPSQVYFPSETERGKIKDSDIKQVENIFNTIHVVLSHINKQKGFTPQVIILEHADNLDLKNIKFESLIRKRWRENGEKLI